SRLFCRRPGSGLVDRQGTWKLYHVATRRQVDWRNAVGSICDSHFRSSSAFTGLSRRHEEDCGTTSRRAPQHCSIGGRVMVCANSCWSRVLLRSEGIKRKRDPTRCWNANEPKTDYTNVDRLATRGLLNATTGVHTASNGGCN